jgi:hypothetical protein
MVEMYLKLAQIRDLRRAIAREGEIEGHLRQAENYLG